MALNIPSSFSIFSPKCPSSSCPRPPTEVRFSRWNNANAQKFIIRERAQKEIEDELRRQRRFDSATRIVENYDPSTADPNEAPSPPSAIKSVGTPSFPSRPSIPGKKSKYSKIPRDDSAYSKNPRRVISHPAFRPINWLSRVPSEDENSAIDGTPGVPPEDENSGIREHTLDKRNSSHPAFRRVRSVSSIAPENSNLGVALGEHGISYRVPNAPFEYQYSYTETPKVKPLALREPPFLPFGPSTMPRPWTGRAPIPPSKKKLPEFDSFRLPAPGKKGVKPVQAPGPFLAGSGPKYVKSREEILGEPLTEQEVKELIKGTMKSKRQLHMGRDGLTHNMLDNIHSHWKRKRVCKIKCIGVCTVDMDNVRQQLEEKTGGKIIYNRGGVIYLFRGRNYNYKTRPRYPLMLWRPITPVYPRLIQRVPEGLTLEEVTAMRKRGRELPPICKLGKNGLYSNLVMNVREAFEECELVRINCQGMNKSDFKKIGGKLKDLVPCVLISFEREHILMWRGKDWKSSLPILGNAVSTTEGKNVPLLENECDQAAESMTEGPSVHTPEHGCNQSTESITEAARVSIPEDGFNQDANCTTDDADVLRIPENEFGQVAETASEGVCISLNSASDCALTGHEEVSDFGASKSPKLDAFVATSNPNTCLGLGGEGLGVNDIPHSETQNQPLAAINGFPNISNGVTIGEEAVISPEKHIGNDDSLSVNEVGCEEPPTLAEAVSENEVGCEESPTLAEVNEVGCEEPPTLAEAVSENEVGCEEPPTLAEAMSENEVGCEESPTLAEAVSENEVGCEEPPTLAEAVSENEAGCEELPTLAEAVSENEAGCEEFLTLAEAVSENEVGCEEPPTLAEAVSENEVGCEESLTLAEAVSENEVVCEEPTSLTGTWQGLENSCPSKPRCTEGVLLLRQQAVEAGLALVLDDDSFDANIVFERAVALVKTAPPGPTFRTRVRKVVRSRSEEKAENNEIPEVREAEAFSEKKKSEKSSRSRNRRRKDTEDPLQPNFVPHGSLKIDELAKLLGS